jgi:tetratricopeptide (TPR) repeat protein
LRRIGIEAEAVYLENAFDLGPHLFTLLKIDDSPIDIENILPGGFDYRDHRREPSRIIWDDRALVADIYHSVGNELFEKGEFSEALRNYDKALKLNPQYERAGLNKAILLDRINMRG